MELMLIVLKCKIYLKIWGWVKMCGWKLNLVRKIKNIF